MNHKLFFFASGAFCLVVSLTVAIRFIGGLTTNPFAALLRLGADFQTFVGGVAFIIFVIAAHRLGIF